MTILSALVFLMLSNALIAADIVLPGARVKYSAGKYGWSGVTETPSFRPKMYPLPPLQEYTLSYTVSFKDGFQWQLGGKLPGLAGGNATSGCAPIDPYGWSVRFMWRQGGKASLYLYDQDRKDFCGDDIDLNYKFKVGRVHHITLQVKVNSPGHSDGEVSVWLDKIHVKTLKGLRLRGLVPTHKTLVDTFMFSTFYGGQGPEWAPDQDTHAEFGNFYLEGQYSL